MATTDPEPPDEDGRRLRLAATVGATLEAVAAWTEEAQEFCARHGAPDGAAYQVALVFEEILANVVEHNGPAVRIEASLEAGGGELRGEVVDDGAAFDPLDAPAPDLAATLEERAVGGLGIHLARTLTDGIGYERSGGRNRLSFVKRLAAAAAPPPPA